MKDHIEDLLAKARWRQEINKRGYEGKLPVASEHLQEALRTELRAILDNDGKPFDLQVARHVYDFAIAAKDLLAVAVKSVEDVMRVIADNNGAMASLTGSRRSRTARTTPSRSISAGQAVLPVRARRNASPLPSLAVTPSSVRGDDICAGCGNRECFNVCCHPSNKLRKPSRGAFR